MNGESKPAGYTYILRCNDGTLYTGWTTDLEKRRKCHNSGKGAKYTRSRLPVELVYSESFAVREEAMAREAKIKQMTRTEKLRLISSGGGEKKKEEENERI